MIHYKAKGDKPRPGHTWKAGTTLCGLRQVDEIAHYADGMCMSCSHINWLLGDVHPEIVGGRRDTRTPMERMA